MTACRRRIIMDLAGAIFEVRITPRETPYGISPLANSLTFETHDGRWVGALPVYRSVSLQEWTDDQLVVLLSEAQRCR